VLNERGKFCAKIFLHYADTVIFVLGHFIVTYPVVTGTLDSIVTIRPRFESHRGPLASNLEQVANLHCLLRSTQPPILSGMKNEYSLIYRGLTRTHTNSDNAIKDSHSKTHVNKCAATPSSLQTAIKGPSNADLTLNFVLKNK